MVGRNRRSVLAAALVLVVLAASLVLAGARRGAAAAADTTPPVLVSLTMTPGTIDTSNGPVTITAEARVTDASGLSIGGRVPLSRLVLTGPGGQQHATAYLSQAQRVSGSALDGIYDTTLIVPWHAEPGQWSASVVLVDIYGNTATLAAADLASAGLPSGIVQTGPGDTTAPSLVSLSIAPGSVDTSLAPATIVVSARVIDDLAGVSDGVGVAPSQVVLRGPTGAHHARATLDVTHRVAGNSLDATYSVPVILPRWSEQGTWVVESVTLVDEVGNTATVGAPGVSFSQSGIGDIVPPRFRSFSLSTSNVDVRSAAANITMQARIVDDRSGVAQGLTDSPSEVLFDSPSGRQEVVAVFGLAQLVLGNGLDGTYSQVVSIPAHAEPGAWTLRLGWAVDQAGNSISLSATDWSAAGFPSSFTVVSDTPPDTGPTLPPAPSTSSTTFAGGITSTTDTAPDTSSSTTSTSLAPDSSTTATSSVPADSSTTTTTSTTPIDSSTTTSTGPDTTTTAATITTTASTTTVAAGGSTTTSTTTVAAGGSTTTITTTTTTPVAASGRATVADGYWFVASTGSVAGFG
ncbi:MAG TPA: hypothetical protein VN636_08850, partial [Acidimicrobiia bacterium]|nr:hypothetical protein [Acidimicrobiia bacterium]